MKGFRLSIREFSDLEFAVGTLDTDGTEDFELGRFDDGELGLKVGRDGEWGAMCRLVDWATGAAAQRER